MTIGVIATLRVQSGKGQEFEKVFDVVGGLVTR